MTSVLSEKSCVSQSSVTSMPLTQLEDEKEDSKSFIQQKRETIQNMWELHFEESKHKKRDLKYTRISIKTSIDQLYIQLIRILGAEVSFGIQQQIDSDIREMLFVKKLNQQEIQIDFDIKRLQFKESIFGSS